MTTKRQEYYRRRAKRILQELVISLNKGALMSQKPVALDAIDRQYITRCLRDRIDYLKLGPAKSLGLEAFNSKAAEAKVEIEYLENIVLKMAGGSGLKTLPR